MYCRTILLVRPPKSYNFHRRSVSTHVNPRTDLRRYLVPPTPIPSYRPTDIFFYLQRPYPRTDLQTYLVPSTPVPSYRPTGISCTSRYRPTKIHLVPLPPFLVQPNGSPWYKSFNEPMVQTLCPETYPPLWYIYGHRLHLHPAVNIPDEMSALPDHKTPGFVPGTSHQTLKSEICTIRPPIRSYILNPKP